MRSLLSALSYAGNTAPFLCVHILRGTAIGHSRFPLMPDIKLHRMFIYLKACSETLGCAITYTMYTALSAFTVSMKFKGLQRHMLGVAELEEGSIVLGLSCLAIVMSFMGIFCYATTIFWHSDANTRRVVPSAEPTGNAHAPPAVEQCASEGSPRRGVKHREHSTKSWCDSEEGQPVSQFVLLDEFLTGFGNILATTVPFVVAQAFAVLLLVNTLPKTRSFC